MCRFSAAGKHTTFHALWRPAAEKRQGTKSRRRVVLRPGRGRYGDLAMGRDLQARRLATAIRLGLERNLNVMARMLLNGDCTFCPICNFNELAVAKRAHRVMSFATSFRQQHGAN